jgi:hypothetical protein
MDDFLEDYCRANAKPVWMEYHAARIVHTLGHGNFTEGQKKAKIAAEREKIGRFLELMEKPDMTLREAEQRVWPESVTFYEDHFQIRVQMMKEDEDAKKPKVEPKPIPKKKAKMRLSNKLYIERELSQKQRDKLLAKGYSRLKISPFGDSGAAYYWVRRRYNESKEHAFFCYILAAELKRHVQKVKLNVNSGPDAVVEHEGRRYCFDVETGKSLSRQPKYLRHKFSQYRKEYSGSFVFVTKKSLRFKYAKYGEVITRGKLRKTLAKLFK